MATSFLNRKERIKEEILVHQEGRKNTVSENMGKHKTFLLLSPLSSFEGPSKKEKQRTETEI